jgi:excinuclease ABC subunit C
MPVFRFNPKRYPTGPGCYLMKDLRGKVIYVGKAKNLRRRLASYFRQNPGYWKVERLVEEIEDIEIILVHNEVESLVLENNLIKRYRPHYNAFLVSDRSSYPYILLTRETFPRFVPFKRHLINKWLKGLKEEDCQRRFGPYLSYHFQQELLSFVAEKFKLRVCDPMPARACLFYHMGKCSAPCEGRIGEVEYALSVEAAADFLSQANTELIQGLKEHMHACADRLEFERAARLKEQITALELGMEMQVVERDIDYDQHVLYFGEEKALVAELKKGKLLGVELSELERHASYTEACRRFVLTRYMQDQCPPELIVNHLERAAEIENGLSTIHQRPIRITIPGDGPEYELVTLCELNYRYRLEGKPEQEEN